MAFSAGTKVGRHHPQKTKRTRKTNRTRSTPRPSALHCSHSYSATLARSEWRREQQGPPRDEGLQPINQLPMRKLTLQAPSTCANWGNGGAKAVPLAQAFPQSSAELSSQELPEPFQAKSLAVPRNKNIMILVTTHTLVTVRPVRIPQYGC